MTTRVLCTNGFWHKMIFIGPKVVATVLGGNQPDVTARKSYQPEHGCCYSCYYCRMVIPLFDAKCYWIILISRISRKPKTTNLDPHDNVTGMMLGISQKLSPGKSCFRGEFFKVHTGWQAGRESIFQVLFLGGVGSTTSQSPKNWCTRVALKRGLSACSLENLSIDRHNG